MGAAAGCGDNMSIRRRNRIYNSSQNSLRNLVVLNSAALPKEEHKRKGMGSNLGINYSELTKSRMEDRESSVCKPIFSTAENNQIGFG